MRKSLLLPILSSLLLLIFVSCSQDPNIYSHLGYDPLSKVEVQADFLSVSEGESFDVLSLAGDSFRRSIRITYTASQDLRLLKAMDSTQLEALAQALDYASRYGDVDAYLSRELSVGVKAACVDTKKFVQKAVSDLQGQIDTLVEYLGPYAETLEDGKVLIDALLTELIEYMDPDTGTSTVQDYIAIQLAENVVAAALRCMHIILLDATTDAITYTWEEIINSNIWSTAGVEASIRANAPALVSVFVRALADLDLTAANISGFVSLSTILEGLL